MKATPTPFVRALVLMAITIAVVLSACVQPPVPTQETVEVQAITATQPANGATNASATSPVQLTFNQAMNKPTVEQAVTIFTGLYDPAANPSTFTKLQLTAMCDGKWRVRNPNPFPISFTWDIYKGNELGGGVVLGNGDAFFYSSPRPQTGNKTARLFVNNQQQQVKASNNTACTGAAPYTFAWSNDATVNITPTEPFAAGTAYTVVVSTLAKNTAGGLSHTQPYIFSFKTASSTGGSSTKATIGPDGGTLTLSDGTTAVFPAGFLTTAVEVELSNNSQRSMYYPQNFQDINAAETFAPIALNTVITIPTSAIDQGAINSDKVLRVRIPATQDYQKLGLSEIRYSFNSTNLMSIDQYRAGNTNDNNWKTASENAHVKLSELAAMKRVYNPSLVSISILPVGLKAFTGTGNQGISTMNLVTKTGEYPPTPATIEQGLYVVTDEFNPSATYPKVSSLTSVEHRLPVGIVEASPDELNYDKIPLILVHGFDGTEVATGTAPNPARVTYSIPAVYGSAMEPWLKALFSNDEIRKRYQLYLFGYDFRQSMSRSGKLLEYSIRKTFGSVPVVIASYSMGGNVVQKFINREPQNKSQVVSWITIGSGFEGSKILLCIQISQLGCADADINPLVVQRFSALSSETIEDFTLGFGIPQVASDFLTTQILGQVIGLLATYDGVLDVTWQYARAEFGEPFINNPSTQNQNNLAEYKNAIAFYSSNPEDLAPSNDIDAGLQSFWNTTDDVITPSDGLFDCSSSTIANRASCGSGSAFGKTVDFGGRANHTNFPKVAIPELINELLAIPLPGYIAIRPDQLFNTAPKLCDGGIIAYDPKRVSKIYTSLRPAGTLPEPANYLATFEGDPCNTYSIQEVNFEDTFQDKSIAYTILLDKKPGVLSDDNASENFIPKPYVVRVVAVDDNNRVISVSETGFAVYSGKGALWDPQPCYVTPGVAYVDYCVLPVSELQPDPLGGAVNYSDFNDLNHILLSDAGVTDIWRDGVIKPVVNSEGFLFTGAGLNNLDHIAGTGFSNNQQEAVLWRDETFTSIRQNARATDLNDADIVAGIMEDDALFRWTPATNGASPITQIASGETSTGDPVINQEGTIAFSSVRGSCDVVDDAGEPTLHSVVALWRYNATLRDYSTIPGPYTPKFGYVTGLNDHEDVVGIGVVGPCASSNSPSQYMFMQRQGERYYKSIDECFEGFFPFCFESLNSINNRGDAVGSMVELDTNGDSQCEVGIIWDFNATAPEELEYGLDPASGYSPSQGISINNNGVIVARGALPGPSCENREYRFYLLIPMSQR
jgi:Bacterial Ig-like domain